MKFKYSAMYQFDKKRILIADDKRIEVHTYDPYNEELCCILASYEVAEHESIVLAEFLDDLCPKFILLLINDKINNQARFCVK